jgi:hypothetical protein
VIFRDAGNQDLLLPIRQSCRDLDYLLRSFAGTKNNFRESFSQSTVGIDLRESKIHYWRSLERAKHLVPFYGSGPELLEQLDRFRRGHKLTMPQKGQIPRSNHHVTVIYCGLR